MIQPWRHVLNEHQYDVWNWKVKTLALCLFKILIKYHQPWSTNTVILTLLWVRIMSPYEKTILNLFLPEEINW